MNRRQLLAVGGASALLIALGGGAVAWWRPARVAGLLQPDARQMLARVADAVLGDALPASVGERSTALQAQVDRVERTTAGMPPALQAEVDQLLALLLAPPGRTLLLGLTTAWPQATRADIQQALQRLRTSRVTLRQQAFRALRDLTNAAYFADPAAWQLLGYPGPRAV